MAEFEALNLAPKETVQIVAETRAGRGAAAVDDVRWLELYSRHEEAWRVWIVQSQSGRTQDLGVVNYA
ncbi:hypothetical protein [Bradyrhizobium sp. 192]|uniref:hypothetical protein n=1 Tax=Bradyrhizobium sp. 192 TaxID=2782660 RepID=UPI001FFF87EC|nr:hypothetical protein [Bradyrhizobium sp. 192]